MTQNSGIRVYLAGAGFIAQHHADAIDSLPVDASLVVADPDPEARSTFTDDHPEARTLSDTTEMFDEPARDSDIVIVATPPAHHHDITVEGLESGRNVLCEKPLALNVAEVRSMVETARTENRLLGCCSCRFVGTPTTDRVRSLLDAGDLGDPFHATWITRSQRSFPGLSNGRLWALDSSVNGGGTLMEWGPYDVTTLEHILNPDAVTVSGAWTATPETDVDLPEDVRFDVELHAGATLRYHRDGPDVIVTYERTDCTHGEERSTFELEGTVGAVTWDWTIGNEGEITVGRDVHGEVETETETLSTNGPAMLHRPLAYFHRIMNGGNAPIPVNGDAGFNFACLRAIYDAAESGKPCRVTREDWT